MANRQELDISKLSLPQQQDIPWQDKQYPFDGEWMPDVDPALIGARNFASIINLRYNDRSIEGVNGYTRINETYVIDGGATVGAGGTYIYINDGWQLRTDRDTNSYVLVHSQDSSGNGRIYQNTGTIHTSSEFDDDVNLDVNGNPYYADGTANLVPRFSNAPQNSVCYCNGKASLIFSGAEHRLSAAFQVVGATNYGVIDITDEMNSTSSEASSTKTLDANLVTNGTMEADANWTSVGTPTTNERSTTQVHNGTYSRKLVVDAANEGIKSDTFSMTSGETYNVSLWVYPDTATQVTVEVFDGAGVSCYNTAHTGLVQDAWNKITFQCTDTGAGGGANAYIQIDSGAEAADTYYIDDVSVVQADDRDYLIIMTTRPIQGFKFYVGTANTAVADLEVDYWNGTVWTAVSGLDFSDTEDTATKALSGTGVVTFTHTYGSVKPLHFEELYLYAYRVAFDGGSTASAGIYNITVDPAMQPLCDVWDGIYRQPIQCQVYDATDAAYQDYTLHVNQSSDVAAPVGCDIGAIGAAGDHIYIMFEEQQAGIRYIMLGNLYNKNASVTTLSYWDGLTWTAVSNFSDGTSVSGKTFAQSGLMSWTPPSDEEPQTQFGSVGYMYKLTFSAALTGAAGAQDDIIDLILGVPALLDPVKPFKFSALYQNRLMLGGYEVGSEGNRMDFSVSNAPDVWNGFESSANGIQSLYFGGVENITCAAQLYNRFGASIFSMLMVFKDTEVYLLVGESPEDFTIYPVAETVGCPAPHTLAVAEVGFDVGQGLTRNVAIWLSHYGPMMFDGAILSPILGINNYFDPNENEYIEWDYLKRARGWVDQTYKEYNLLVPSGASQTTCNLWLVYDLIRKKWFRKDTGTAAFPQCAWNVMDPDTGEQKVYGGIDTGRMIELEDGTSWNATFGTNNDGTGITQLLKTGDFFPSDNMWDLVLIRKFKLICKKLPASTSATVLSMNYYANSGTGGSNVIFQDADSSLGTNVDFYDMDVDGDGTNETEWESAASGTMNLSLSVGLDRVVRLIQDMNNLGWAHAFQFDVTTTDASKGWQPIIWGIQYRVERKDNKAVGAD